MCQTEYRWPGTHRANLERHRQQFLTFSAQKRSLPGANHAKLRPNEIHQKIEDDGFHTKCLFLKAKPELDFRYFSKSIALFSVKKAE
jgi:hypothetical protein